VTGADTPATTVTISGLAGTGTSTLARVLERRLGLPYVYGGRIFREAAAARGLSLAEFGRLCEQDATVDRALDDRQVELLRDGGLILESRLAGWLAHREGIDALKVCLVCDEDERIRRIVGREGGDLEAQRLATLEREASEAARYEAYYGLELHSLTPYDLVLDSARWTPDRLADIVLTALG
jgi:cytidylate kinase